MKRKTLVYLGLITLIASRSSTAHAQTFSVIYNFDGADGAGPLGVTLRNGVLYGTTVGNNQSSRGTVFETKDAASSWVTSLIFPFYDVEHGRYPAKRVFFGPDGHLYGTTIQGGSANFGVVFELVPPLTICKTADCYWKENIQYSFQAGSDGNGPSGDLIWDQQGNIYGTTQAGGLTGAGNVYELTRSSNGWTESTLHNFTTTDGSMPLAGVAFDRYGNLLGTTSAGGSHNAGTVFELKYAVGSGWTETVLYSFQNGSDGGNPAAGLISDSAGNFYGATAGGGNGGGGTVFELLPSGDSYTFQVLYELPNSLNAGCGPQESLSIDAVGSLYGTTYCGGTRFFGTVFKLTKIGNGWTYTSLHDFSQQDDGGSPISNVAIDANGNLYGAASAGGSQGSGVLWMIKP